MSAIRSIATVAYFYEEVARFREVMCSRRYTEEQKDRAFDGLTFVYLNLPSEAPERVEHVFVATSDEFIRRKVLEAFRPKESAR